MNYMKKVHRIQFPRQDLNSLPQDETYFYWIHDGEKQKIRFHDYDLIYNMPGLYEQLFYDRLKCKSPSKIAEVLKLTLSTNEANFSELRVLDLGAGNGMVGEVLQKQGIARLVGVDLIEEARKACYRDRPEVYDAYYTADLCDLSEETQEELASWKFDCLTCVAALGFGDIPPRAFVEAFQFVQKNGWTAFNIKETFLHSSDDSGFSRLIRELIFSEFLDVHHLERYQHRLSVDGEPLFYYAITGRKRADISQDFKDKFLDEESQDGGIKKGLGVSF